jgi:hypothetical protein
MVVTAKTSNKLIRIRELYIDYVGHAQPLFAAYGFGHFILLDTLFSAGVSIGLCVEFGWKSGKKPAVSSASPPLTRDFSNFAFSLPVNAFYGHVQVTLVKSCLVMLRAFVTIRAVHGQESLISQASGSEY